MRTHECELSKCKSGKLFETRHCWAQRCWNFNMLKNYLCTNVFLRNYIHSESDVAGTMMWKRCVHFILGNGHSIYFARQGNSLTRCRRVHKYVVLTVPHKQCWTVGMALCANLGYQYSKKPIYKTQYWPNQLPPFIWTSTIVVTRVYKLVNNATEKLPRVAVTKC